MLAKLIIDGKEFEIEVQDPSSLAIILPPKKKTGYERVKIGKSFYSIRADGTVFQPVDKNQESYKTYFDVANYYSDRSIAENNARADKLMRQLRRFSAEHRENALDYDCGVYIIHWDGKSITANRIYSKDFGHVLFDSYKTCSSAINTFYDELLWYFTEYKDIC